MSKYRINVRFDTDDPKQAEAVKFLQSLEYSRNAFIVGYLELPSLARQHNYREETRKGVAVEYVPNALPA